jgi:YfiH family protein
LVTDRAGGVSPAPFDTFNLGDHVGDDTAAVAENRRRLQRAVGAPVRYMTQVHGADVATVRAAHGPPPEADALVTDLAGVALAVLVADCVPVLLTSPRAVGVAHAGRRGTASAVVPAAVAAMCALGADPADIEARLGPAVCGACYEVPAPMQAEMVAAVPAARATTRAGTPGLDLRAGIAAQLAAAGVARVAVSGRCTAEDAACYSYRRDGETGRFAGVVWL